MGQTVMGQRSRGLGAIEQHLLVLEVDAQHLGHQHLDVALLAQDAAQGARDRARRQSSRRHLVEQWLEEVVVVRIDERDSHRLTGERPHRRQPCEATPNDHDPRQAFVHQDSIGISGFGREPSPGGGTGERSGNER